MSGIWFYIVLFVRKLAIFIGKSYQIGMDGFHFALIKKKKNLNIYHTYPLMYCKVPSGLLKKGERKIASQLFSSSHLM